MAKLKQINPELTARLQIEVWIAEEHTIEPHLEKILVNRIVMENGNLMVYGSHDNRPIAVNLSTMEVFWVVPDDEM